MMGVFYPSEIGVIVPTIFTDLVIVKKIDLFIEVMKSDKNGRQNKLQPSLASKCKGPKKGNSSNFNIVH